jgi:hypothetical protein
LTCTAQSSIEAAACGDGMRMGFRIFYFSAMWLDGELAMAAG